MKSTLMIALLTMLVMPPTMLRASDAEAPELPKTETLTDAPETEAGAKTEVENPTGVPEIKKENVKVVQEKPGRFRWGNFFLGALGGAVLSVGLGIPLRAASNADGSLDGSKIGILAGAGAVGGGLLSFLLGATSPLPATPPDMSVAPSPSLGSAKQLVFRVHF